MRLAAIGISYPDLHPDGNLVKVGNTDILADSDKPGRGQEMTTKTRKHENAKEALQAERLRFGPASLQGFRGQPGLDDRRFIQLGRRSEYPTSRVPGCRGGRNPLARAGHAVVPSVGLGARDVLGHRRRGRKLNPRGGRAGRDHFHARLRRNHRARHNRLAVGTRQKHRVRGHRMEAGVRLHTRWQRRAHRRPQFRADAGNRLSRLLRDRPGALAGLGLFADG